jgi:hypothetical protein
MAPACPSAGRTTPLGQALACVAPTRPTRLRRLASLGGALFLLQTGTPAPAQSNNVRITKLSDIAFGSLANSNIDTITAQSICVFAATATNGYRVTAAGSAAGGAFELISGSDTLPYDVQWNSLASQSSGAQLTPNTALTGLTSLATQQTCNSGPPTSASLILIVRATTLGTAAAGTYSGSLTLLIGPE